MAMTILKTSSKLPTWAVLMVPAVCLAVLLLLGSQREITALESDASVAVYMSLGYLNGSTPPLYPPGLSFFISMMRSEGVPLRIANIVLTFAVSGSVMFFMLHRVGGYKSRVLAGSLFGLFFASIPTIVFEGDITGNVFFSGLCNLSLFASLAVATGSTRRWAYAAIVLFAGMAAISRPDTEIILVVLVAFPIIAPVFSSNRKADFFRSVGACCVALLAMIAAQQTVKWYNYKTYGVDGVANYLDSRYSDLFATIASLPSSTSTDHYFLADKSRRTLAYSLSPTLKNYQSLIESDVGLGAVGFDAGVQFFGKRDIANAFYYWHLDNVFHGAGLPLADYLAVLGKSAGEIRASARAKNIDLRRPLFGVISRDYGSWLPSFPVGLEKAYRYSFQERMESVKYGSASPELKVAYDHAALRRAALLEAGEGVYPAPLFTTAYGFLHSGIFYIFGPLMVTAVIVAAAKRGSGSRVRWFLLIALGSFIARVLYYGLLDASFYRATVNYLNPNFILVYFIVPAAFLLLFETGAFPAVFRVHRRARSENPSQLKIIA